MTRTTNNTALKTTVLAASTAIVAVFTLIVKIPTPTGGYVNLCDVAIFFIAYTFSPLTALIAAGLGTALADLIGGYPQWAIISFIVHGLEGLALALIIKIKKDSIISFILASVVGIVIVGGGYFVLTGLFLTTWETALASIPGNLLQGAVGAVLGIAVHKAVVKAYPPILDLR